MLFMYKLQKILMDSNSSQETINVRLSTYIKYLRMFLSYFQNFVDDLLEKAKTLWTFKPTLKWNQEMFSLR